ncbi:MAG TPA: tRNA (N6-threonylcarbamoyladenosine(37)-N6)-methyltransferase TrmO [Tenuifilaceae bacterium]|nr:tRNA (N6-threonylcarbamoyladenosine(37)-N6)-methyltransferase TrmO [Tenuifilaceae bacterium]
MKISYEPIGIINTPFKLKKGMPIQSNGAKGIKGTVTVKKEYSEGLKDLEGFSHIYLIYHFHKSKNYSLTVKPFLDNNFHGVFSTRAPQRPNSIGLSVVKLVSVTGNVLEVENVDMLDGTPLIDIKPYIPDFDVFEVEKVGWTNNKTENIDAIKSDNRFE